MSKHKIIPGIFGKSIGSDIYMIKPIVKDTFFLSQKSEPSTEKFTGFTAQIIQHEMDHLEGIII